MDPLKPFTSLIRSVWGQPSRRVESTPHSAETTSATEHKEFVQVAGTQPVQSLHSRLRMRLARLSQWEPVNARQLFIECVLTGELGKDLENDPAFSAMVQRVSQLLGTDAKLSMRLDELLKRLAAGELVT